VQNASSVDIGCLVRVACSFSNVTITSTQSVDISCEDSYACQGVDFLFDAQTVSLKSSAWRAVSGNINGLRIDSSLTLDCLETGDVNVPESCRDVNVHCPNATDSTCDVICESEGLCLSLSVYTESAYQGLTVATNETYGNIIFLCEAENNGENNCDLMFAEQTPIMCNHTVDGHCAIDCDETECIGRVIDGTAANSLTVDCKGSTCDASTIHCPQTHNASCDIRCVEGTCRFANIIWDSSTDGHTFEMQCGDGDSCQTTRLDFSLPSLEALSVSCLAKDACYAMEVEIAIESVNNVNVTCDGSNACHSISLLSATADTLILNCFGRAACEQAEVQCPEHAADSCQISCDGDRACTSLDITVTGAYWYDYLALWCTEGSCSDSTVSCSTGEKKTAPATLIYDNQTDSYQCDERGGSVCCPWGKREYSEGGRGFEVYVFVVIVAVVLVLVAVVVCFVVGRKWMQRRAGPKGAVTFENEQEIEAERVQTEEMVQFEAVSPDETTTCQ